MHQLRISKKRSEKKHFMSQLKHKSNNTWANGILGCLLKSRKPIGSLVSEKVLASASTCKTLWGDL